MRSLIFDVFDAIALLCLTMFLGWIYPPKHSPESFHNFLCATLSSIVSYTLVRLIGNETRVQPRTLTPQSEDVYVYKTPTYQGKKYKYFTFDQRLGDMDVLADFKPQRAQKLRRRYKKRLDRESERISKQQYDWQVQSGEGLFAGLGAIRTAITDSEQGEFIVKLLEDVILLTYQLSRSRTKLDMSIAVTTFAKLRMTKSLSLTVTEKLLDLKFSELFSEQEVQSADEYFMPLREMLDNYTMVRSLPVFKKMYKFSMYALSLSLFDSMGVDFDTFGYSQVEQAYIKRKFTKSPDFVHCLLDTTLFVCERGYQCFRTRSFQPLVHSGSAYEKWMDDARLLKLQSTCLMNPKAHGFTYFDFLSRLNDSIEKGEAIVSFFRHSTKSDDRSEGHFVQRALDNLRLIRATELTKRAAREGRPAPFATLVYGGSSVGKSTFIDMLFHHFGKTFDLPTEPEYKYTRIFTDANWSGFHTSMWCIVMDDLAFRKAGYALGDISLDEMIQIINNVSFTPPQADLPDKGKIPLRSEFVIASTNAEHLNAYSYFHNALAVQRRLPYVVEISPKEEYTRDKVFLDSSKVPSLPDGEYPDLWNITVKRVVPFDNSITTQMATHEIVKTFTDVNEFLAFYSGLAHEHRRVQAKVMLAGDSMASLQVCKSCFYTAAKCSCDAPDFSHSSTMSVQTGDLDQFINITSHRENFFFDQETLKGNVSYLGLMWLYVLVHIAQFFVVMASRSNWTGYFIRQFFARCITSRPFHVLLMYISRRMVGSMSRRWLRFLGDRSTALLAAPPKLISVIQGLSLILAIYKTFTVIRNSFPKKEEGDEPIKRERLNSEMTLSQLEHTQIQGNVQSTSRLSETIGVRPVSSGTQRESVWMKNDYVTSREDVNPLTIGWNSMEFTQVLSLLDRNCCTFVARRDVNGTLVRRNNRAVCVGGQIFMTNNHGLPVDCDIDLEVIFSSSKDGVNPNLRMIIRQNMIHRVPEKDLAFIELRNLPPFKNIAPLFPNETLFGKYSGSYVAKDEMGVAVKFPVSIYNSGKQFVKSTDSAKFDREFNVWWAQADRDTVRGDCGSLMVARTNFGPTILGLHFLGGDNKTVAALAVTRADVESGMNHFGHLHVQNGPPSLEAKGFPRPLVDLHHKASIRYIPDGSAKAYGSFAGMRANHKSRVCKTFISEAMQSRGYEIKTGAPVMRGWEPWNLALKDMVHPTCNVEEDLLDDCVSAFSKEILSALTPEQLKGLMILDNNTAVNGAPGVGFIDKMNRNTSMGNPWKKSKKDFLKVMPENEVWQDGVIFTDDILDRVDEIIGKYQQGVRVKPNFCAHLKDEAVIFRKIAACKTRVFTGAPADWSIVVRKYLLSFVKLVQDNKYVFEAGPGTICQSLEWEEMFEYLTQHGADSIIAGDYGKFDKKMIAAFILAAFEVIINIHRAAGWTEEQLKVLKCIAMDTAFPLVDFNGDLIEFLGTNPSGHPLTVIINSLVNALYMRYCFAKCAPIDTVVVDDKESSGIRGILQRLWKGQVSNTLDDIRKARQELLAEFKIFVALMTYGDDNVMGVSPLVPWFNHTTIQNVLASIGVEYTMADKESHSVPFITINDVAFLKRRWRWDSDVGAMLAPLEHDSIEKMLTMCVASKTICAEAQAVEVIESALNEYFFYGKDVYEAKRSMMISVINETGIAAFVTESTLPTWDALLSRFWENSTHVELGKFRTYFSPERPEPFRRMPSRRGTCSTPTEALDDSDCSEVLSESEERMDHHLSAPERSSKSIFMEVPGTGTTPLKDELGFGEPCSGIQPPTNTTQQMSGDYKPYTQIALEVQSDEFEELLQMSDAERGRLMRITWKSGEYVAYKRMLLRAHRVHHDFIHQITPEEQMRLLHELELIVQRNGAQHQDAHEVQSGDEPEWEEQYVAARLASHKLKFGCLKRQLTKSECRAIAHDIVGAIKRRRHYYYDVQSGDDTEAPSITIAQNLTFADGEAYAPNLMESLTGPTYDGDTDTAAQLADFLSRPVIINQFTWAESSTTVFQTNYNPWSLYFGDAKIAKKLDNYARIHCKLHLKFVINASPFYYGAMRACYSPLQSPIYTTQPNDQIPYSQRPGVWLEPQTMTTVEMELPFLNPANWIDTNLLANFDAMGRIDYVQYAKMRSANGVSGSGITITCYAWATDVTTAGPTTALTVQSDEYVENTTVSDTATAIAGVASKLTSVPVIGDFARATEMGARAAAGMAKLFGYSNPPVITDVNPMQPKSFHAMANVDTCVPHDKLALDSKNEINMSNTVAGTDSDDTLALANLITRESFMIGALWDGSNLPGTLVLSWLVTPVPNFTSSQPNNLYSWYTPLSYFGRMFAQWRGSIHYKLRFIKTKYHRGRVVVSWDPNANIALTSDTETTCYSRIVDLEHEDEVDFIVPYKATNPWLTMTRGGIDNAVSNGPTPGYTLDKNTTNGVVTVRVLNVITGPAASPQVDILLFSKAGDDFMMSVPTQLPTDTGFYVQSGDETDVVSHETLAVDEYVCGVTVGESIASLRPLLHRTVFSMTQEVGAYMTGTSSWEGAGYKLCTNLFPKFPLPYGFDPRGLSWASTAPARRYNWVNNHPIDWVLNAFVGVRGSTVVQVNVHSESSASSLATGLSIERLYGNYTFTTTQQNTNRWTTSPPTVGGSASSVAKINVVPNSFAGLPARALGNRGVTLTNQRTQTAVSAVIPQYTKGRFTPAPANLRNPATVGGEISYENFRVDTTFRQNTNGALTVPWPTMDVFYAAGVDFNPVFFLSTPRLYVYAAPAANDSFVPA